MSNACSIIHQVCHGRRQQVHQSSPGNTTVKSSLKYMAWMSTTAKHVGTILHEDLPNKSKDDVYKLRDQIENEIFENLGDTPLE